MNSTCVKCSAPLRPNAKFCTICGEKQPVREKRQEMMHCPQCGTDRKTGYNFCTKCNYDFKNERPSALSQSSIPQKVQTARGLDLPQNVKQYKTHIAEYAEDGVLEAFEEKQLNQHQQRLKISDAKHRELLQAFPDLIIGIPFNFQLEIGSFKSLKTGHRGMGIVRFTADRSFSDCIIYGWSATDYNKIDKKRCFTIRANISERWTMGIEPKIPGSYDMEYVLEFKLRSGKRVYFKNRTPILLMVPKEGDTIQNVNISFGDKAIAQFKDGMPIPSQTSNSGFRQQDSWQDIEFSPILVEEFNYWKSEKSGQAYVEFKERRSLVNPNPSGLSFQEVVEKVPEPDGPEHYDTLVGAPLTSFEVVWEYGGIDNRTQVCLKDKVVFGRPFGGQADFKLSVEPIKDYAIVNGKPKDPNLQKTFRVSAAHMQLGINTNGVYMIDKSSNGTKINNTRVQKSKPVNITTKTMVALGDVLDLTVQPLFEKSGITGGVLVRRPKNSTHKSYIMVNGTVGIWPMLSTLFGDVCKGGVEAPLLLERKRNGNVVLKNNRVSECIVETQALSIQDSIVLKGDKIVLFLDDKVLSLERVTN